MTFAPTLLILESDASGISVEMELNGVLLRREAARQRSRSAFKLNGWELAGTNLLRILLSLLPNKKDRLVAGTLHILLRGCRPDELAEADAVLGTFTWPVVPEGNLTTLPQEVFRLEFTAIPAATWAWTQADVLPALSLADINEAANLLDALCLALAAGDIAKIVQIHEVQITEGAIALGILPSDMLARYREFLLQRIRSGGWTVNRLDRSGLTLHPMAGGRLHKAEGPNGTFPVMANSAAGMLGIAPFLARRAGQWFIAR